MRSNLTNFSSQCSHLTAPEVSPFTNRGRLPVVVGGPYVQGSEWPSTSQVILCQWHSAI